MVCCSFYGTSHSATDSPLSGKTPHAKFLSQIDLVVQFKLYLVWRFDDNSLYFLGNVDWTVSFQADTYQVDLGVTRITVPNGVLSDPYVRSHAHPVHKALAPPVANDSLEIIPI